MMLVRYQRFLLCVLLPTYTSSLKSRDRMTITVKIQQDGSTVVEVVDAKASLASQMYCPKCSKRVEVKINKKASSGTVTCPNCALKYETTFKTNPDLTEPVDIYAEMMDKYFKRMRVR